MSGVRGVGAGVPLVPESMEGESSLDPARLKPGDLVKVEILETSGKGEGLLRVDGRILRGLFPEVLPRGARLSLRFVDVGPPLRLQLPGQAEPNVRPLLHTPAQGLATAVGILLGRVPAEDPGGGAAADLLSAIRRLLGLPREPEGLARALARWVRGSGLFHEARLARGEDPADVKSLVLKLLARLPEGELARAARAMLGHVEAHQARSVLEQAHVVPLVLPWGREWVQGELRVEDERPRAPHSGGASGRIGIRLHMPRLGLVEVGLRWGTEMLSVRLGVEPQALGAARSRLGELAAALAQAPGWSVADLRAEPLPAPTAQPGPGLVQVLA